MEERRNENDYVIRAIAADGQIRAFAACTRDMVEEARQRHGSSPVVTAALGRLMTAAAMMGAMMKGEEDKLTLKIKGDGPAGALTVVCDSHGNVKGFAANPVVLLHANAKGKLDVSGAVGQGELTIVRDIGLKEPYIGSCKLVSGEIAEDLTYYYAASAQTPSSVALGVLMNRNNTVRRAGGFILQLMPGVDEEAISALEQTLAQLPPVTSLLDEGLSPEDILLRVIGEFSPEITDKEPVRFCCDCSKEKVTKAIVSLGEKDLRELIADGEETEVHCDFCNTNYYFSARELEEILARAVQ